MATIRKRYTKQGHVRYQAQIRLTQGERKSATFKRKSEALEWAARVETLIVEGKYLPERRSRHHKVHEAIQRYLREVLPRKRESTREPQRLLLRWWDRQIGHRALAEVTPALLSGCRQRLLTTPGRNGCQRGPASANRYLATLSHVFTIAMREWEWVQDNPCPQISKLREPRGRTRYLSRGERMRLLKACRSSPEPLLYPIALVALFTGMRKGEILSLRWADVDLDVGRVTLRETKNGETRTIPLVGSALEIVCKLSSEFEGQSEYVFPANPVSGETSRTLDIRPAWKRVIADTGIEDFHFHDLRHTFASELAGNGASLAAIAELLGHKTLQMVKRYAHLSEEHGRRELEKLAESMKSD